MKKIAILLFVSFFSLLFVLILVIKQNGEQISDIKREVAEQKTFQKQVNEQGDISIELTPLSLAKGKEASFSLLLDTHSVNLDYDIASLATIIDEKGQRYSAKQWTGGRGGHHLSGTLGFPPLALSSSRVTLVISNIDNTERRFTWDL